MFDYLAAFFGSVTGGALMTWLGIHFGRRQEKKKLQRDKR